MKKLLSAALALCLTLCLCAPAFAAQNSMDNFRRTAAYNNNFADVSASHWAAPSVKTCYEYGLMTGSGGGKFTPGGTLTVAQALVMADRVHEIYATGGSTLQNGSPWYQPYVDYAIANGIIRAGDFTNYNAAISRADMAYIFANALPVSALPAINAVLSLPDVTVFTPHADEIFLLYNAGVLTGNDSFGTFKPNDTISRAEAAAIISRVAIPSERRSVTLLEEFPYNNRSIVLALPAGTIEIPDNTGSSYISDNAMAIIANTTDSAFWGISITDIFTSDSIEGILFNDFLDQNILLTNIHTDIVYFGSIVAFRTTGTATSSYSIENFVCYNYIYGNTSITIMLTSSDNALLTNMADNLQVSGSTVSPKLS